MLVAAYTFLDVFWSMFVFFIWVLWFWLLFTIWGDIFRRDDISGWAKTGWVLFTLVLPFLGVFVYLITQNEGMTERRIARAPRRRETYEQEYSPPELPRASAAVEIERGKALLDRGVITQAEFDVMKTNALA